MSQAFAGSSPLVAYQMPWTQPAIHLLRRGQYLGEQLGTGVPVYLDLQQLIADGDIRDGDLGVFALKRGGKGTLTKCIADGLLKSQSGFDNGEHVPTRQLANDFKLEEGGGEWGGVVKKARRRSHVLVERGKISPYDRRTNNDQIDDAQLTVLILSQVKGSRLDDDEVLNVQVVLDEIHRFSEVEVTLELIDRAISSMDRLRLEGYLTGDGYAELKKMYQQACADDQEFSTYFDLIVDAPSNLSREDALYNTFIAANGRVSSYFNSLLRTGLYGQLFGGNESLYEALEDEFVHFDWVGLPREAATLLELVMAFWRGKSARLNSGNSRIAPHFVWSDEQGSEQQRNELRTQLKAEENRKRRSVVTIETDMYQYADDPLKLGAVGSELRRYGEIIFKGKAAWFGGKQPNDDDTLDTITRIGATDFEAFQFTRLPQGSWGLLAPGHPVEWFAHRVLPSQWKMIDAEGAARRSAQRQPVTSMDVYQERMKVLHGFNDTPEEAPDEDQP